MPVEQEQALNAKLAEFKRDPKAFMNRLPSKTVVQNGADSVEPFSDAAVAQQAFIDARDHQRMTVLQPGSTDMQAPSRAPIASNDRPENLVDSLNLTTLEAIENAGLKQAYLPESPWSDDYWATYKGILGARYADPSFPANPDWKKNYDYIRANPTANILASGSAARINRMSPSEKYDALIGDSSETLTRAMWAEGKRYYDTHGDVESWMGICHGWAPAAYMLARPTKAITLKTPRNIPITFYPSDIKALASLLWANAPSSTKFIGGRCNDKEPQTDPLTGRALSSQCFDTNPGTWHLAMVNQIGANKRGLVLDATFDYQVWNQPAYGYSYTYFNPQTDNAVRTIAEAKVAIANYTNDKFKKYRSPQAVAVVGIEMSVSYVVETRPSQRDTDNPSYDAIRKVAYLYDLELDANGKIIGGEWYQNPHPDFLWTPPKGARAQTRYEAQAVGEWNANAALPTAWQAAAKSAAANQIAPLAVIVEQLIKFANSNSSTVNPTPSPSTPISPVPSPSNPTPPPTPSPSANTGGSWLARLLGRLFGA